MQRSIIGRTVEIVEDFAVFVGACNGVGVPLPCYDRGVRICIHLPCRPTEACPRSGGQAEGRPSANRQGGLAHQVPVDHALQISNAAVHVLVAEAAGELTFTTGRVTLDGRGGRMI